MTPVVVPAAAPAALLPNRYASAARRALAHDWLLCAVLAALWFGLTAGLRPLAMPDEGRYVGVAWEMLRSGDWLVPTQNGHPFFHKPPLFYWITAGSMALFGPGVWAARLASLLAATVLTTVLFRFVRHWRGARFAWTVTAVLATTPLFYGASQYANLDPLVAACVSLAILLVAQATLSQEAGRQSRGAVAAAFVAAACGVLAKGLIGVALPVLVLLAWGLVTRRLARVLRLMLWWPGWLIFFAVAAPWFITMQAKFPAFGHYFFVVQHVQRFVATGFNNAQPFWFYPALLAVAMLPWSPWALAVLRRGCWTAPDPRGLRMLMWIWAATVTVFFSLPRSKPIGYILPALPPLAWLIADAVEQLRQRAARREPPGSARFWRALRRATAVLAASFCVTAVVIEHFYQPKSHAAVATRLQAGHRSGEPVVFLGNYYFDVPFYARLRAPVLVADDWLPAEVARDSWRRELVDAETFRQPGWQHRLLHYDELEAALRGKGTAWVVGPATAASGNAWLAAQQLVYQHDGTALWRTRAAAVPAGGVPAR